MIGIVLAAISNVFEEIAQSIGKKEIRDKAASYYTIGFLGLLFSTTFLLVEGLVRNHLIFSLASLPTFLTRVALEILQAYVSVRALGLADRGDFGFVRSFTIPLLLGIDVFLGYTISLPQIVGMGLVMISVFILIYAEAGTIKGLPFLIIATINAAATITLYKYDISHFNSVEAEQAIISVILTIYFFACARHFANENPFRFLRKRIFLMQSAASGISSVFSGFAFAYAPASVILATLRCIAVLFALISGRFYFKEQHFLVRVSLCGLLVMGLILIVPR